MKTLTQRAWTMLALVVLTALLMVGTPSAADAAPIGISGQQVQVNAANRNAQGKTLPGFVELSVTGNNQKNQRVTWTWRGGASYSVTTTNWWWKGGVTIQAKYANGATKTCSGNVPTVSLSNTYAITCTSDIANLPPNAPSSARVGDILINSMAVSWNDNTGAINGEQDFRVERRSNNGSWSQVKIVPANTTRFVDTGLTMGTVYCYRVRAYNSAGGYSGYSNETCGKPMDPKLNGKKVTLDPGHGWGVDPGAVANGMKEKDITLEIARLTKARLEPYGIQVSLTRNGDEPSLTLSDAWRRVNGYNPNLAVAIHANAGGGTGTESCYVVGKSTSSQSQKLAGLLSNEVSRQMGLPKRGDFPENDASRCARKSVTGWNKIYIHDMEPVAALIETAFIDAKSPAPDVSMLRNRRGDFAKAISDAIIAYLRSY